MVARFNSNCFAKLAAFAAAILLSVVAPANATTPPKIQPTLYVVIDVSSQSMQVEVNGRYYSKWKISTAAEGYHTPRGTYRVQRVAKEYYSRKYYSVFFNGGYAVHGTDHIKSLGRPASHGCVRLHPRNAAKLFDLVQKYGAKSTKISIVD